ncbi:helix-turn-helix domain-containing protein [Vibrio astriarenae]|uniref:Helix-turn-helix domain-containing protein n=1 Tax=Vibrio astriarenae TaxID=1481923 RepID=A0A7Z2T686_9VIBR|nr:AraC family transcriptional regulator [Vibrio astriarenae]QIA65082.1 helix-turn-helix domain-containing protein [Vibrio astriarenae]
MKRAEKFVIPNSWRVMFNDLGISLQAALGYAQLPIGLFDQTKIQLSPSQYFQFWDGIERAAQDRGIELPLKLAEVMSFECFDAPIFTAICSPNLNAAMKRLQAYKPLIGPMIMDLEFTDSETKLELSCYGYEGERPRTFNLTELVFFTQLARLATRKHIKPVEIVLPTMPSDIEAYQEYFGCEISQGTKTAISFDAKDAKTPFLTNNQTMLGVLETEVKKQLDAISEFQATSARVYEHLMDILPQGESSIEVVASNMAMSKRTLQRKLAAEGKSYQAILNQVREDLAHYYLTKTDLPIAEVSFLLGFQETNSFTRAYTAWAGVSPTQVRN